MKKMSNAIIASLLLAVAACAYAEETTPAKEKSTPATVDVRKCGKPAYPTESARNEEEGTVVLRFLISAEGDVLKSMIDRSSGYRDLDKAALEFLANCKQYKPATVDGKNVESWIRIAYQWKLF